MLIDTLISTFENKCGNDALIWNNTLYKYSWLSEAVHKWSEQLAEYGIKQGSLVALQGDYSPNTIAILVALIKTRCVIVPITTKNKVKKDEFCNTAQVEYVIAVDDSDKVEFKQLCSSLDNKLILSMKKNERAGLVFFSSGTTGKSKAALHDFEILFEKFKAEKRCMRVIAFLLFDHIGGLNTLFYTLFNAGCLIIPENRTPKNVCDYIDKYKAEALTTTPTFLNLLILSEIIPDYELRSLRFINYGTEVMPERILKKLGFLLPNVRLSQAYGLSEVGVLPARSKSSDSLLIKIDNDRFDVRVVDGLLEIKGDFSMLGYLNAPDPFTNDGWFKTGDAVEVFGEYIRVLGRKSELINVGGEKVYPAEIENILQKIEGVEQVIVFSEHHVITGQIVVAKVKLTNNEKLTDFRARVYGFCKTQLPAYKIPQKIILTTDNLYNERFKMIRNI